MKRLLKSTAIIRGAAAFLLSLFVLGLQAWAYDKDDCSRTVTCSDGYKIITTTCSSSYNITIINGKRIYTDTDDNNGGNNEQGSGHSHDNDSVWGPNYHRPQPHPNPPPDPCREGHGYMIDDGTNNSNSTAVNNTTTPSSSEDTVSDDPYHLREKLKLNK